MDNIRVTGNLTNNLGNRITRNSVPKMPGGSFSDAIKKSINEVNQVQKDADQMITNMVTGTEPDLHKTMIAMEKANISFQLLMQVRNKIVSAYQEINRMQV